MLLYVALHKTGSSSLCETLVAAAHRFKWPRSLATFGKYAVHINCETVSSNATQFASVPYRKHSTFGSICCAAPLRVACDQALEWAKLAAASQQAHGAGRDYLLQVKGWEVLKTELGYSVGALNPHAFCPSHFAYVTLMREPLARVRSHACFEPITNASSLFRTNISSDVASRHRRFVYSRAAIENYYVRMLASVQPMAGETEVGWVNERDLQRAIRVLGHFRAVLRLERLDEDIVQLGPPLLPAVPAVVKSPRRSTGSSRKQTHCDELSAAMVHANRYDVRLYEHAQELAEGLTRAARTRTIAVASQPHGGP
jgi:hypothetical protein